MMFLRRVSVHVEVTYHDVDRIRAETWGVKPNDFFAIPSCACHRVGVGRRIHPSSLSDHPLQ
jgi:hypothetical protein